MDFPFAFLQVPSSANWLLVAYSAAIVLASVVGGWLPSIVRFTHTRMQILISYVGGLMLGIAIFHLLPHAIAETGIESIDRIVWSMMIGLLVMFFLLRAFHFHQHGPTDFGHVGPDSLCEHHDHKGGHDHGHSHEPAKHSLRWLGVLVGLGIHTLLDGVALAAAVQADAHADQTFGLWGIGVFIAIVLHKPLDAISITSLMQTEGWPIKSRVIVNCGFAMMAPLGALLMVLGAMNESLIGHELIGYSLAFSAGVFLCISLSDLLPEMEFHSHNRLQLTLALLLGIATAVAVGAFEPEHSHEQHQHSSGSTIPLAFHFVQPSISNRSSPKATL